MNIIVLENLKDWKKRIENTIRKLQVSQNDIQFGCDEDKLIQQQINKKRIVIEEIDKEFERINSKDLQKQNANR